MRHKGFSLIEIVAKQGRAGVLARPDGQDARPTESFLTLPIQGLLSPPLAGDGRPGRGQLKGFTDFFRALIK